MFSGYRSLAYAGASRSFMFTQWGNSWNQPLWHLPHFFSPQFCRSKLNSHKHFSFFIAFSVILVFQNYKVQFKSLCTKSKNRCSFSTINQTLFVQLEFWNSKCDFILQVLWLNALFGSNSKGLKNWTFLPRDWGLSKFEIWKGWLLLIPNK